MVSPSFKSAGAYPYKLLNHAARYIKAGRFLPTHIFVYPTNACNLKCIYCCCGDEDRKAPPIEINTFTEIVGLSKPRAITFAGGGEPLMHPEIERLVSWAYAYGIKLGIMTNGILADKFDASFWKKFTWVRISMDAGRKEIPFLEHPRLSYSWVGETTDVTEEIFQLKEEGKVASVNVMRDIHLTKQHERGAGRCFMPLVRPVFAPDGSVYACCRAHYAFNDGKRRLPERLKVAENIHDYVLRPTNPIDGSICDRCYYGDFNRLMAKIETTMAINDLEFI